MTFDQNELKSLKQQIFIWNSSEGKLAVLNEVEEVGFD